MKSSSQETQTPHIKHDVMSCRRQNIVCFGVLALLSLFVYYRLKCQYRCQSFLMSSQEKMVYEENHKVIPYGDDTAIIFIGGMPRSGTTLMRAMLEVRCGEETRVIPQILELRKKWESSGIENKRLNEGGITIDTIDFAVRAFMLEIITRHGPPAPHLCNKDPFVLKSTAYLHTQFPSSKFLLMIRDGRTVVHSIISRRVTIKGFDMISYRNILAKWNEILSSMYSQCLSVGPSYCMPVYYEQLALHPEVWMGRILEFLNIPWNDSVLHHEEYIGKPGGIALSKIEKSTDQVIKPVNTEALSKWVGHILDDVLRDMETIAPMLKELGYDPKANPPNYGKPDSQVAENTLHIKKNAEFWKAKEAHILEKGANVNNDHTY